MFESYIDVLKSGQNHLDQPFSILLIEDNRFDAELFKERIIDTQFYQSKIMVAESMSEAKEASADQEYDLVVADLQLPDANRKSVVNVLLGSFAKYPIIILTGMKDVTFATKAIKLGVQDYLVKDNLNQLSLEAAITHALERHKIYNRLQYTIDNLQTKNKLLSQISRSLSHDYRSPINNIIALLRLMDIDPLNKGLYRDKSLESAELLLKNMEKMLSNLNNYQDIYQEITEIDFQNIWEEIYLGLVGLINECGAEITTDFSKAESIYYSDFYVRSAMQNLISNSLKYHCPDRKLHIHISTKHVNGFICLSVKDNGLGIDMAKYGRSLFGFKKRFHDQSTGSGLGLFNLRNQVELMGGFVEVKSNENTGSEFLVYFKQQQN